MSEDTTTEAPMDEPSDKEINFARLREQLEEANARIAALQPLAVEKAVRSAGFDPDAPDGKALARLASQGGEVDAEAVKNLATELGFEPSSPAPALNPLEQSTVAFADRQQQIASVSVSDTPADLASQIAEAEAAGQWSKVIALKNQASLAGGPRF